MVTLLIGKKGSGKTKRLIEEANAAVESSKGSVVVIEKGAKLTYNLTPNARLVDTDAYAVKGYDTLYGFLSGICAGNYDITDIFVDSTFKIAGDDKEALAAFVKKLNALAEEAKTAITLLISAAKDDLPTDIEATLEEL
ncbi:MAG: hypothetical protein II931_05690 [Clostridia bacterium]|nr:hypothetical protein [Clostridia bacterium]